MLPGMEMLGCQIDVPASIMQHVVKVESSYNPYAIGVVRGRLARQPQNLQEAVATAGMLESKGFNFSLGLAQVNRFNLKKYGIGSYAEAFDKCRNLKAGARILLECNKRAEGHWGKSFSCYYSGNFTTGYREGYVQKIERSMYSQAREDQGSLAIPLVGSKAKLTTTGRKAAANRRTAITPALTPAEPPLVSRRSATSASADKSSEPPKSSSEAKAPVDEAFVF